MATPSAESFELLNSKLKLQTTQRLKLQQELSTITTKFDEYKSLQEKVQIILVHQHETETTTNNKRIETLENMIKVIKEGNVQISNAENVQIQMKNIELENNVADLEAKLTTEKIRSKQNMELFVQTREKYESLQEQYSTSQLTDANLETLIKLQLQIDQAAINDLNNKSNLNGVNNGNIDNEYRNVSVLAEELFRLKNREKAQLLELSALRLQLQELTEQVGRVNGSLKANNNNNNNNNNNHNDEKIKRLENQNNELQIELQHAQDLISEAQISEKKYSDEISSLKSVIGEQKQGYQTLLTQYNQTQQRLKQSHEQFTTSLENEMASLSLLSKNSNESPIANIEQQDMIIELENQNRTQKDSIEKFVAQITSLQAEILTINQHNDELILQINQSKNTIDLINEKHSDLEKTIISLKDNKQLLASTASTQIKTVLEAVNIARQERDVYRQEVVDKEELLVKLTSRYQTEMMEQRQEQIGMYIGQLQQIQAELSDFREELISIRDYIENLTSNGKNNTDSNNNNNNNNNDEQSDKAKNNILGIVQNYVKEQNETLTFLKKRYDTEVKLRKTIFNQLQELKGNIRVFARLRPTSQAEKTVQGDIVPVQCISDGDLRVIQDKDGKKTAFPFEFEKVFNQSSTQQDVFDEVKDLISSCLDGYNVCIFAYGQTGTGKTFTIEGAGGDLKGVNPRALEMLFNHTKQTQDEWDWDIKLTMVEIYNEKIQDLLRTNDNGDINLKIVAGKDGKNEVAGCNVVSVTSAEEVQKYLQKGKKNRHMSATAMNAESSRSHLIVTVFTNGYNRLTKVTTTGRLNLIDLAGSERISKSCVSGDGLKEAQNINASLSNLGTVIAARANKQAHVPYRNSQLTYLLQDSLDKNSKTLMIVQLSPSIESVGETLCSLRFAARVKEVELGKASASKAVSKE